MLHLGAQAEFHHGEERLAVLLAQLVKGGGELEIRGEVVHTVDGGGELLVERGRGAKVDVVQVAREHAELLAQRVLPQPTHRHRLDDARECLLIRRGAHGAIDLLNGHILALEEIRYEVAAEEASGTREEYAAHLLDRRDGLQAARLETVDKPVELVQRLLALGRQRTIEHTKRIDR